MSRSFQGALRPQGGGGAGWRKRRGGRGGEGGKGEEAESSLETRHLPGEEGIRDSIEVRLSTQRKEHSSERLGGQQVSKARAHRTQWQPVDSKEQLV